jgi:hemerythrin
MLDYPQVALDFMNRDHAEFDALREKLLALLPMHPPASEVDNLLEAMLEHTRHHFAAEELLMQETRFPPYPMHKGEHDSVLADMAARIENWKRERDVPELRGWLDKTVGDWFVTHINTMDFITAGFIAKQKKG